MEAGQAPGDEGGGRASKPVPKAQLQSTHCLLTASIPGWWMPEIPPLRPVRLTRPSKVLLGATAQVQDSARKALYCVSFYLYC